MRVIDHVGPKQDKLGDQKASRTSSRIIQTGLSVIEQIEQVVSAISDNAECLLWSVKRDQLFKGGIHVDLIITCQEHEPRS